MRTVRHLRLRQITSRIVRRFRKVRIDTTPAPRLRASAALATRALTRPVSLRDDGAIRLIGEYRRITNKADWNDATIPKLWLYNLHYHDGLRAPEASVALKRAHLTNWREQNPPASGNGWEPYPMSLRIVNWIVWALSAERLSDADIASLAVQTRALTSQLEYHLLGNHIWANAKAMILAGLFFEGKEAERWLAQGFAIASRQLNEQFLDDGGHFEISPSYHALMIEDVLDVMNLASGCGVSLDQKWVEVATAGLAWLKVMTREDGRSPLFNDAFIDIAPTTDALADYASRLGIAVLAPTSGLVSLSESGYHRWSQAGLSCWVDYGRIGPDYIPGHAHADCFSFELTVDGRPVVVDTGTSTYDVGPRRAYERGTTAHNTVTINDEDQAELWAAFRVGRRPAIHDLEIAGTSISAWHDGYMRLGARHTRRFDFAQSLRLTDRIDRHSANGTATARFHLAPMLAPTLSGNGVRAGGVEFSFEGATSISLEPCEIAESINRRCLTERIVVGFDNILVTTITRCASSS